ncbi:response regulator [Acinetobacter baumannii]
MISSETSPVETRIVIIDDEPQIRKFLDIALRTQKYKTTLCETGYKGLEALATQGADLVILDLGLPDLDGKEVLQELRSWSNVPVIVLSVRADEYEKVALLDAGANDYMTKPFSVQELLARIRVILRNQPIQQEAHIYDDGYLKVDVTQRLVWIEQQPITLTRKEFQLLTLLMRYQGQLLTQPQLLKELWGPTHQEDTHYLRILVGNKLRSKLGDNAIQPRYIATEPGVGLRFLAKQKNH